MAESSPAGTALAGIALISLISCAAVKKDIANHPLLLSKPPAAEIGKKTCDPVFTAPWQDGTLLIENDRFVYKWKKGRGVIDFGFSLFPEFGCPQQAMGRPDFTMVLTDTHLVLTNGSATAFQSFQPVSEAYAFRTLELASYANYGKEKLIAFTSNRDLEGFMLYCASDGKGTLSVRGTNGGEEHYMQPLPEDFRFSPQAKPVLVHYQDELYIFRSEGPIFLKVKKIGSGKPEVYYVSSRSGLPKEVKKELE
jgi:hypothetical protein